MDADSLKALVEEYLVARQEFDNDDDENDDVLYKAIDALECADRIVDAIRPLFESE